MLSLSNIKEGNLGLREIVICQRVCKLYFYPSSPGHPPVDTQLCSGQGLGGPGLMAQLSGWGVTVKGSRIQIGIST